mmetsp:Transcript_4475/g.11762  ORF Transcript_4475/g.11762 Transcript_4475/m.11762 type:complete len:185 (-) Transcript_4475:66-620(-)
MPTHKRLLQVRHRVETNDTQSLDQLTVEVLNTDELPFILLDEPPQPRGRDSRFDVEYGGVWTTDCEQWRTSVHGGSGCELYLPDLIVFAYSAHVCMTTNSLTSNWSTLERQDAQNGSDRSNDDNSAGKSHVNHDLPDIRSHFADRGSNAQGGEDSSCSMTDAFIKWLLLFSFMYSPYQRSSRYE